MFALKEHNVVIEVFPDQMPYHLCPEPDEARVFYVHKPDIHGMMTISADSYQLAPVKIYDIPYDSMFYARYEVECPGKTPNTYTSYKLFGQIYTGERFMDEER